VRFLAAYALGVAAVCFTGCEQKIELNDELVQEDTTTHDHSTHHHGAIDARIFSPDRPLPDVSLNVEQDAMNGWNVHIVSENFTFTPEKVNQAPSANEGHAHIFVDGYKIARIYGNWFHLKPLTPGVHEVSVSLNANNHSVWHDGNVPISANYTVHQP